MQARALLTRSCWKTDDSHAASMTSLKVCSYRAKQRSLLSTTVQDFGVIKSHYQTSHHILPIGGHKFLQDLHNTAFLTRKVLLSTNRCIEHGENPVRKGTVQFSIHFLNCLSSSDTCGGSTLSHVSQDERKGRSGHVACILWG